MKGILRSVWSVVGWAYSIAVLAFLFLPALIIVPASLSDSEMLEFPPRDLTLRWYEAILSSEPWLSSARMSLWLSLGAALVATLVAILVALSQLLHGNVSPAMRGYLSAPIAAPHVIVATGLFSVFLYGGFGLGELWSLILVNAAIALPLAIAALLPAFEGIDPQLWTAASTLGARPFRILRSIILPVVGTNVIAALILTFHSSWDETTFSVFIGPTVTPFLPSRMFSYLQQNVTPEIAAVATLLLIISLLGGALILLIRRPRHAGRRKNAKTAGGIE